jgi:hypothetical protein
VPASAETAERRNGQVSFVFWLCAVGWDREFESAFLHQRVINEPDRANWAINSPVADEDCYLANARASWLTAS